MTEFQVTAASLAILLEVFSEDAEKFFHRSALMAKDSNKLKQMQDRVSAGAFWEQLGGLVYLERQLRTGFSETFPFRYDDKGEKQSVEFPDELGKLFCSLRNCDNSAVNLMPTAMCALPYLRAFVEGKSAP